MREIKFRVIIPEYKINKVFTLVDLIKKPWPIFSDREFIIPWLLEGNKPDRYIGIKNKNGKEIYEKDIVAWWNDLIGEEVIFKNGGFTIESVGYYGKVNWEACRIIGNITENPELLEEKK